MRGIRTVSPKRDRGPAEEAGESLPAQAGHPRHNLRSDTIPEVFDDIEN
jgi:hypothetical protein